jgi:phage-related baseplate assembly protein
MNFADRETLDPATVRTVISSLEVSNENPITGDVSNITTSEIKRRIFDTFPTQNRAVTQADYENLTYRMSAKYGSIKRCSVQRDPDSLKRNLNLYVISEDQNGYLTATNSTIKNNLKVWLNHFRMISDTIDILDPYIINFGIDFIVKPASNADKFILLDACVEALRKKYSTAFFIGETIYISDIYEALKAVTGVLDVVKVKLINKSGGSYSGVEININQNLSPDGSYLIVPKNAILELKYPDVDIKGKIR